MVVPAGLEVALEEVSFPLSGLLAGMLLFFFSLRMIKLLALFKSTPIQQPPSNKICNEMVWHFVKVIQT
jgi:hypothetical protein